MNRAMQKNIFSMAQSGAVGSARQNVAALADSLVASGKAETKRLDRLKEELTAVSQSDNSRVSRREVPFISSQTPLSVPPWAAGQQATKNLSALSGVAYKKLGIFPFACRTHSCTTVMSLSECGSGFGIVSRAAFLKHC